MQQLAAALQLIDTNDFATNLAPTKDLALFMHAAAASCEFDSLTKRTAKLGFQRCGMRATSGGERGSRSESQPTLTPKGRADPSLLIDCVRNDA
jgi:hypothetical protein